MPKQDGKGPVWGGGPGTGWGLGPCCAPSQMAWGCCGWGLGHGRLWCPCPTTEEGEAEYLEKMAEMLDQKLKVVKGRIAELKKAK